MACYFRTHYRHRAACCLVWERVFGLESWNSCFEWIVEVQRTRDADFWQTLDAFHFVRFVSSYGGRLKLSLSLCFSHECFKGFASHRESVPIAGAERDENEVSKDSPRNFAPARSMKPNRFRSNAPGRDELQAVDCNAACKNVL